MTSSANENKVKSQYEEGALKVRKLTSTQVIFTVVGCGVGSGCLGTAYGARFAGFPVILHFGLLCLVLQHYFPCIMLQRQLCEQEE